MILIFLTREFVIEDSVVQRDLPKIWSLSREMDFQRENKDQQPLQSFVFVFVNFVQSVIPEAVES